MEKGEFYIFRAGAINGKPLSKEERDELLLIEDSLIMKDKIEKLIAEHKILKQEVWYQLEELNNMSSDKLLQTEKEALEQLKNC
jgi:hypothetical protein